MSGEKKDIIFTNLFFSLIALEASNLSNFLAYKQFFYKRDNDFVTLFLRKVTRKCLNRIKIKKLNTFLTNGKIEKDHFKQYLKKFSFLYRSFTLNTYPNNVFRLDNKKLNIVAVESLYLLNNLDISLA
jgi:hypothetical protein